MLTVLAILTFVSTAIGEAVHSPGDGEETNTRPIDPSSPKVQTRKERLDLDASEDVLLAHAEQIVPTDESPPIEESELEAWDTLRKKLLRKLKDSLVPPAKAPKELKEIQDAIQTLTDALSRGRRISFANVLASLSPVNASPPEDVPTQHPGSSLKAAQTLTEETEEKPSYQPINNVAPKGESQPRPPAENTSIIPTPSSASPTPQVPQNVSSVLLPTFTTSAPSLLTSSPFPYKIDGSLETAIPSSSRTKTTSAYGPGSTTVGDIEVNSSYEPSFSTTTTSRPNSTAQLFEVSRPLAQPEEIQQTALEENRQTTRWDRIKGKSSELAYNSPSLKDEGESDELVGDISRWLGY